MKIPLTFFLGFLALISAHAADPTPATTTPLRVKTVPETQFFCAKKELKIAEAGQFATETLPALARQATELKLGQNGPLILSFIGFTGDPEQNFTLEAGFPVQTGKHDDQGTFYFRTVPKFKCASVIYQGSVAGIGDAWKKFVADAFAAGYKPTGETRERYLAWESPESENNIIELQFGIE
jgi:effector-binding domain-containing protein